VTFGNPLLLLSTSDIAHRCAWEAATVAIIRFSAMGAKVIRNVAIERLKAAAEQMPNKHEPVRGPPFARGSGC